MSANSLYNQIATSPLVSLGDYIVECDERNDMGIYGVDDVRGISIQKKLIDTKADMTGVSLSPYKVLKPREFCYVTVTSRNGGKISLAINDEQKAFIVSSSYITFKSKDNDILLPEYLFLLLSRPEFDRYSRFNSWGSARETFDWSEMCRTQVPLPSIDTQRELVAVYNGLKSLAEENEALLQPLQDACQALILNCRNYYPLIKIGDKIKPVKEKNSDLEITLEQGINIDKEFITPHRSNSDLSSRIKVRTGQFAYCTQLNNENTAISYRKGPDCVVSPVYAVFQIINEEELLPEYLFLWLRRSEFGRYVYWGSIGSAYEFFQYENLANYQIPLPPKEVQQSIVNLYRCYEEAKQISVHARQMLKDICPSLIKRAAHSA